MKKAILALALAALCAFPALAQEKVSVSAAANISAVASDLAAAFAAKYPSYRAEFTFGSSGNLVTQILNGAPVEVFMSADMGFAQKLVDSGAAAGKAQVYAVGSLILLSTKRLNFSKGLAVLTDPAVIQVANANPETAPYGRAAQEALTKAGLWDKVKAKIVTAQTITQSLQFTLTSADAGFVNKSALYSKELKPYDKEGTYWIAVDPALYTPIEQGFVVLKAAAAKPGAEAFAKFLGSPEAKAVFAAYGYGAP